MSNCVYLHAAYSGPSKNLGLCSVEILFLFKSACEFKADQRPLRKHEAG